MQNLFSHIAYLLTKHECVIIPEFGALVHHVIITQSGVTENIFAPPTLSLGFNPELKHNDGLLINSVSKEQKISYNEAKNIILDFSYQFKSLLNAKNEVIVPLVGNFNLVDNKIEFTPASDLSSNANYFGFKNFYMPILENIENTVISKSEEILITEEKEPVLLIPIGRKLLGIVSSVAIILLFLLFSTPINNKDIPAQYASMFYVSSTNQEITPKKKATESVVVVTTTEQMSEKKPGIDNLKAIKPETMNNNLSEQKSSGKSLNTEIKTNESTYYIVVASFPTQPDAEKMLKGFEKEFGKVSIISKNNRHRIYIQSFNDKTEAESFLEKFRINNPKHQDAWLLSSKG